MLKEIKLAYELGKTRGMFYSSIAEGKFKITRRKVQKEELKCVKLAKDSGIDYHTFERLLRHS